MKKILLSLFFFVVVTGISSTAFAEPTLNTNNAPVNIYFFYGDGCPHCAKEEIFLDTLVEEDPAITIHRFEVWKNTKNRDLMIQFAKKLNATVNGVPFTIIGDKYIVGWLDDKNSGSRLLEYIACVRAGTCEEIGKNIITVTQNETQQVKKETPIGAIPETLPVPFFGEIQTKNLSLPVLTIIIGALDGFNPCAMWTLVFLISLLLGMQSKIRMWTLGSAFIVTSGAVYFLFLSAWLNLLLFIGFIFFVRIAIGLVALGGGSYYLKEYFFNPNAGCPVTKGEKRKKVFEKLRTLTHEKHFFIALFGIMALAVIVNLVELVCSAGLPAVYTQILTLSELPVWQYYSYLLLYIFVFMLDDMVVFFAAMFTLQMTGATDKYSHLSHLIGGIAMVIIGILLIFKPEVLMFG